MTEDVKKSAIRLYESCVIDQLLGETLRPGGLKLTARIAGVAGIGESHTVLDIACGKGTTAFFLAREYNCHVIGIDLSDKMISLCQSRTEGEEVTDRVSFLLGDGENLPFRDSSVDTVISECSFSLLPNKEIAAKDINRILRPGGKLVMTDIILRGKVKRELQSRIAFPCFGGAWRLEEYIRLFERTGFQYPYVEDYSGELKRVGYQLGITFGSIDNFLSRLPEGPCRQKGGGPAPSVESSHDFFRLGRPGYALIAVTKT